MDNFHKEYPIFTIIPALSIFDIFCSDIPIFETPIAPSTNG